MLPLKFLFTWLSGQWKSVWFFVCFLNKVSLNCCNPLVNFQSSEKVDFGRYFQGLHDFDRRVDYWRSLLHNSRNAPFCIIPYSLLPRLMGKCSPMRMPSSTCLTSFFQQCYWHLCSWPSDCLLLSREFYF